MDREKIYKQIAEVIKEKEEHLKEYGRFMDNLAKNKDPFMFMTGRCDKCDGFNRRIKELEDQLK